MRAKLRGADFWSAPLTSAPPNRSLPEPAYRSLRLEKQPVPAVLLLCPHHVPFPAEPPALQVELQLPFVERMRDVGRLSHLVGPRVPDLHRAGAILPLGDGPFRRPRTRGDGPRFRTASLLSDGVYENPLGTAQQASAPPASILRS